MNRLRRFGVSIVCALLCICSVSGVANAHELQQDHGVSAVLHIAPDDNPAANQRTVFNLDFTSQTSGFAVASCGCTLSIQTTTKSTLVSPVVSNQGSRSVGYAVATFPQAGVYDVLVKGRAGQSTAQLFQLVYRVRVTAGSSATATSSANSAKSVQVIMLSATSLVILGVGAAELIRHGGRYSVAK